MIKIDEWEILASHTLLTTKDQVAFVSYKNRGWDLALSFRFNDSSENAELETKIVGEQLHVYLNGWTSELGSCLKEPVEIATLKSSGAKMALMVASYRIGTTNRLDVQLMEKAGTNE